MTTRKIDLETTSLTLEELLSQLAPDTEILLHKGDRLVARIEPASRMTQDQTAKRVLGLHEGAGWIADDFDSALPDDFWFGSDE